MSNVASVIFNFLKTYQLDFMLVLSGVCGIQTIFVLISKALNKRRKLALTLMNISAFILLNADRAAYIYRGNTSTLGFYMVRISNFLVYFITMFIVISFNMYLSDLYLVEGKLKKAPVRLIINYYLFAVGTVMLIVSQFTGFYYYFDEQNRYQRSPANILCYVYPLLIVLIQSSVVIQYRKLVNKIVYTSLILFTIIPLIASILQFFAYGLSLINTTIVGMVVVVYVFSLLDMNNTVAKANELEISLLKEEKKKMHTLFEQTAQSLVTAIDAKDKYTHGHSTRVAEYSLKLAKMEGWNEDKCEELYFAALLHDVGKIGIPDEIINKVGKLTPAEYSEIKKHTILGKEILSGITQSPYLSIGANYHHERYDGKGYPEGLKGEDIPEIARIIAVADAYDAMTSKRSYREPIPQSQVREEIVKGIGFQFDPKYAKNMLHLIDLDSEYEMKEREEIRELSGKDSIDCHSYKSDISEGILLNDYPVKICFNSKTSKKHPLEDCIPTVLLFDSLDARTHEQDNLAEEMLYCIYDEIRLDGRIQEVSSRITKTVEIINPDYVDKKWVMENLLGIDYTVEAVKCKDHVQIKIDNKFKKLTITIALPDSSRYAYIALTGKHCNITDVNIIKSEFEVGEDYIPRIAEEISFLNVPEGDIPNIQINSWRGAATAGIPIKDVLKVNYHTMSLPTARLIWHCPFFSIYTSEDGQVNGPGFREFALIRVDGECWDEDKVATNKTVINRNEKFENWNEWKKKQKEGVDCSIEIKRKGNTIYFEGTNTGIDIKNTTTILENVDNIYFAITGDQCVISNIQIISS
ncbi:MAG: HD-GYP domain-containing protein [Lachnospiraceae bacterium]|nr:HD-GYP domain-containing protein [Lachnospiraceae bacterium]